MKVLIYFSGNLFDAKGTPIRTRNQIAGLLEEGVEVYYAGYAYPEGVAHDRVCMLGTRATRLFQIAQFVNRHAIEVVYMQTSAGVWYVPFLRVLTRAKIGIDFHSRLLQEQRMYHRWSPLKTHILEWLELLWCRSLHFATGVSGTLKTYYESVVPNFLVLPVGVNTHKFSPDISPDEAILNWKGTDVLIGYAGNTKVYQGLETVLAAFSQVAHEGFKMLVIASSGVGEVQEYARTHNLEDRMRILDVQPHEAIPGLLRAADILTVIRPSDEITEYSFPSKLSEYSALGLPLVVSHVSDIATYIEHNHSGFVVAPESVEEVVGAFRTLKDPTVRLKLGREARGLALDAFDQDKLRIVLKEFLEKVAL